jgi:hypothetical protein
VEHCSGRLPWCRLGMRGKGGRPRRRHINEEERQAYARREDSAWRSSTTDVTKTRTLWWIRRELPAVTPPRSWGRTPPRLAPSHTGDDRLLCVALCSMEDELEEGRLPGEGGARRRHTAPRRCCLVKPSTQDLPELLVELCRAGGAGEGGARRPRGSCATRCRGAPAPPAAAGPLLRCEAHRCERRSRWSRDSGREVGTQGGWGERWRK